MGAVASIGKAISGVVEGVGHFIDNTVHSIAKNPLMAIADIAAVATGNGWAIQYINPAMQIAQGADPGKVIGSSLLSAGMGPLGSEVADATGSQMIGNMASSATRAALTGQNPLTAGLTTGINGEFNSALKDATGVSGLPNINVAGALMPSNRSATSLSSMISPLQSNSARLIGAPQNQSSIGQLGMPNLSAPPISPTAPQLLRPNNKLQTQEQPNQLQQLYPDMGQSVSAAHGGSIDYNRIIPELLQQLQRHVPVHHYDEGGTIWDDPDIKSIDWKSIQSIGNPTFSKTFQPTMLNPRVSINPVKMQPLTQMAQGPLNHLIHHAEGGLSKYKEAAPKGHNPEFITGVTGYYAGGRGTGQSDDIPAMLHDGDYVIDADAVAAFGDGSSKAGNEALMRFMHQIPHNRGVEGEPVPAKIADGEVVLPASFVTAIGHGDNKRGAKMLDAMREELREHKRSAPTSKIPPKAKSPLDYLKMAKG